MRYSSVIIAAAAGADKVGSGISGLAVIAAISQLREGMQWALGLRRSEDNNLLDESF